MRLELSDDMMGLCPASFKEKNMEAITTETTVKKTMYKAGDGTLFTTESECKVYEESAICAVKSRLKIRELGVGQYGSLDDILDQGCRRSSYFEVSVDSEDAIKNFIQYLELKKSELGCLLGTSSYYEGSPEKCPYVKPSEIGIGKYIYFENKDCLHVGVTTRDRFIKNVIYAFEMTKKNE